MASTAPELPAIQEFAPLEISHDDDEVTESISQLAKTSINDENEKRVAEKLESGAPVTEAEANMLQSQKHRELGYLPESGSLPAKAMSAADKQHNFQVAADEIGNQIAVYPETVTVQDAAYLESCEAKVIGHRPRHDSISAEAKRVAAHNEKEAQKAASDPAESKQSIDSEDKEAATNEVETEQSADNEENVIQTKTAEKPLPPQIKSALAKEQNYQEAVEVVEPKLINAPDTITKEDAALLHSRDVRAHGMVEKGSITAQVESLAAKNERAAVQPAAQTA